MAIMGMDMAIIAVMTAGAVVIVEGSVVAAAIGIAGLAEVTVAVVAGGGRR